MPNFVTLSNGRANTHMRKHTHKLQTGPAVEMANPGLWFNGLTLGGSNQDIHHVPHFLFCSLPFPDTAGDVLLNCWISAVLTSPFRSKGNSCTSRFNGRKKKTVQTHCRIEKTSNRSKFCAWKSMLCIKLGQPVMTKLYPGTHSRWSEWMLFSSRPFNR